VVMPNTYTSLSCACTAPRQRTPRVPSACRATPRPRPCTSPCPTRACTRSPGPPPARGRARRAAGRSTQCCRTPSEHR
jgi:hypothetical protein